MGKLFTKEDSENEPPMRMSMDAFGNFVAPGSEEKGYLEHIKMMQKRQPQTAEKKREPQKNQRLFFEPSPKFGVGYASSKTSAVSKMKNRFTKIFRRNKE
jgi:hypothetical protein